MRVALLQKLPSAVCLLLSALLSPALLRAADDKPLAEVTLADAANMPAKVWGERAVVDEHPCRVLVAGAAGVIPVKVWWGDSLRPAEGSAFRAHILFKDTAALPIPVELNAGLPGRAEIHRIGGLKDNQWKTAIVPVPWDMIMRAGKTDLTEIVLRAPAGEGVPVEKLTITAGNPVEDEGRWSVETRQWVARVQAEKRKTLVFHPAQTPVLPGAYKEKKIVPYVRSYVRLLFPTSAPAANEAGAPVKIKMALNEIEPAQAGVYANGDDLKDLRVSLDPAGLVDDQGQRLEAEIELLAAEFSVLKARKDKEGNPAPNTFPQRLWPAYAVDVAKGRSHMFWINIATDAAKSKAGTYKGKLKFEAQGVAAEELPLEVEVLPIQLLTMKEARLHMGSCIPNLLPAHELRFLVRQNQNSIDLFTDVVPPIIKKSKTEFELDFTVLDDFCAHAAKAGIENFPLFLGGDPHGFPDTLGLERELYRRVFYDGTDLMAGRKEYIRRVTDAPDKVLPELRALYKKWVTMFMSHAKEKGWPEPLLTPYDESPKWANDPTKYAAKLVYYKDPKSGHDRLPHVFLKDWDDFAAKRKEEGVTVEEIGTGGCGPWIKSHFKDSCAAIHEAWPGARIYASIHHAVPGLTFIEDVEVFCTNAIHEDHALGDKVRAAGPAKTFWQYSGCGDAGDASGPRYVYGFFFGAFDARGSLCWAYNWGERFDTTADTGQWLYAWTSPYSVIRGPYMDGAREGWDDRRYMETLKAVAKKAGREKEATALLDEILNAAVKTRTQEGRDTVNDFFARTNDPGALDTSRHRISAMIIQMTNTAK